MATISAHSFNNTPRRSYITLASFEDDFYSYNGVELGTVEGATSETCPKGRVLRENGRKLYPPADPETSGPYPGIVTYMVGVYDAVSFLNGFINPNYQIFTPLNTDKPTYVPNGHDSDSDSDWESDTNKGAPVFTRGDVLADGDANFGGTLHVEGNAHFVSNVDISGNLSVAGNSIVGNGGSAMVFMNYVDLSSNNVTINAGASGNISCSVANLNSNDLVLITGIGGLPAFINRSGTNNGCFLNGFTVSTGAVVFSITNTGSGSGIYNINHAKALCIRFSGSAVASVPLVVA